MDERYARSYGRLARRHWWWRVRDAAVADLLDHHLPPRGGRRILDVGCGDGRMFPMLSRFGAVEGLEPDEAARTTILPEGTVHAAPFQRPLPVAGPYDLITMFDVLEHLDDPVAALQLCRELLAPDGLLVLTVPALPWLWTSHDDINHHRRRYTANRLRAGLRSAGFAPERIRHLFHGLVPLKLLVRLVETVRTPDDPVPSLPPPIVNETLAAAFRLETVLAAPLARWIPGSSLLAVARPA